MLPVLHKHFAMIKQKSENERMVQLINLKLKKAKVRMKNVSQRMNNTKYWLQD